MKNYDEIEKLLDACLDASTLDAATFDANDKLDALYDIGERYNLFADLGGSCWDERTYFDFPRKIAEVVIRDPKTAEDRDFLKKFFCSRGFVLHGEHLRYIAFYHIEYKQLMDECKAYLQERQNQQHDGFY